MARSTLHIIFAVLEHINVKRHTLDTNQNKIIFLQNVCWVFVKMLGRTTFVYVFSEKNTKSQSMDTLCVSLFVTVSARVPLFDKERLCRCFLGSV